MNIIVKKVDTDVFKSCLTEGHCLIAIIININDGNDYEFKGMHNIQCSFYNKETGERGTKCRQCFYSTRHLIPTMAKLYNKVKNEFK